MQSMYALHFQIKIKIEIEVSLWKIIKYKNRPQHHDNNNDDYYYYTFFYVAAHRIKCEDEDAVIKGLVETGKITLKPNMIDCQHASLFEKKMQHQR